MLTAQELNALADLCEKAAPQLRRLAQLDIAGAEANVARLNQEGPRLIEHYKTQAKAEAREEIGHELNAHNLRIKSEREAHQAHMAEERAAAAKDRSEAARILAELRLKTEQRLAAAHKAALEALD